MDRPEIVVFRDGPLVFLEWALLALAVLGVGAAIVAGAGFAAVLLAAVGAWFGIMRRHDLPRVELYPDRIVLRSFTTTSIPYAEIVGVSIGARWWAGRSALVLDRGHGHNTAVPAGAGLNVPRWHLELRDELNRRTDVDLF